MSTSTQHDRQLVAVVGMACRFPGARDVQEYWDNLLEGASFLSPLMDGEARAKGVPDSVRGHERYVPVSGAVAGIEDFDASYFGISPAEAAVMDPQHRLFLEETVHALEDAGWAGRASGRRVGVFCGSGENRYGTLLPAPGSGASSHRGMSDAPAMLPLRASYHLDLRGPSVFVSSLCATGLAAVHLARRSLLAGDCDVALAGAVSLQLPHEHGYVAHDGSVMSPSGALRPFDRAADGTVPGSGVGIVVMRRLEDAVRDGDLVHAVIHGTALNNDGADRQSFAAPSVRGQREVILAALREAQVDPATIGYIEAHGTGTPIGDPIELAALLEAREQLGVTASCALGAVKSSVGHLDSAAGMAGLIKAVLAVREGVIPATIGHRVLNPAVDLGDSGLYVNTERRPWSPASHPRRAAVTALSVGGTNAHLVLGQYTPAPATDRSARPGAEATQPYLFPLSAHTPTVFQRLRERLVNVLDGPAVPACSDVAHTLQVGRAPRELRRAYVASSPAELQAGLKDDAAPFSRGRIHLALDLTGRPSAAPSLLGRLQVPEGTLENASDCERAFLLGHGALTALAELGVAPDLFVATGAGVFLSAAAGGAMDTDVALTCAVRLERACDVLRGDGDLSVCEQELAAMEKELAAAQFRPLSTAVRCVTTDEVFPNGSVPSVDRLLEVAQTAVMEGADTAEGGMPPGEDCPDVLQALASREGWLALLGHCWERGADLDWDAVRDPSARITALPGYPFEPVRHWAVPEAADPVRESAPAALGSPAPAVHDDTDVLAEVTSVWEAVLGVSDIAPDADFFALGGHSLVAAQIMARLRERFAVRIPLGDLLDAETPAGMTELVEERLASARLYTELSAAEGEETTGVFEL
ncbi:beta-ketoacyl synthase N-terminal-like domain-containing protein [Streptomyces sp. FL07-04A]|uniref:beta-ketoacyl synthase N-terminal-like domain-containing protein n=1 Tax=Streptomyces sp. FL07-04A TaxID=3028658 RepID=UPI0029ACF155|nr:beta-ketoacyl synthase N-terminal-like domain-containing protein [Streptomyces sp. FL07-04A]MDX3578124.1 beta-ketoacyl synthase N-terminal-like domain-containing protein [Streptomyces sp. FL07-04A]